MFDNMDVYYTGSSDDPALNAGVDRFQSTPPAENYLDLYYEPTGELRIPVLTLHTTRDPAVPITHEDVYQAIVEAAGSGGWLVQQSLDRYGHCAITTNEMVSAFEDLAGWVEDGVVPTGGDVTQP